jgi:hypothetical protein
MFTEYTSSLQKMSSQVISYRLSTKEVLELRQKALPGESDSQIAQRLMRVVLGLSTETSTSSTLTLNERIESIVEEKLSTFAANQNDLLNRLQERLQQIEFHLEETVTKVKAQVNSISVDNVDDIVDKVEGEGEGVTEPVVNTVDNAVDKKSDSEALLPSPLALPKASADRFLSGADLARRLGVNQTTLSKNRAKPNFAQWTQGKDPEQLAWKYVSKMKQYKTVLSTYSSTTSMRNSV